MSWNLKDHQNLDPIKSISIELIQVLGVQILVATVFSPRSFVDNLFMAASLQEIKLGQRWASGSRCLVQNFPLQYRQSPTILTGRSEHWDEWLFKCEHFLELLTG